MTVYLQVGGKSNKNEAFLFNLSISKNIFTQVWKEGAGKYSDPKWKIYNKLGMLKGYLSIEGFLIECDYFEEVINVLHKDIVETLKKDKGNKNVTFIEVFNLDPKLCFGTDKYSLLVKDCEDKVTKIEEEYQEKIKQRDLDRVKDILNKGTTRFFDVEVKYIYQVEKRYLKNNTNNFKIYGKNIEDVQAWVREKYAWGKKSESFFSELVEEPKIKELPENEVFACHASYVDCFSYYKTTDLNNKKETV